MRVERQLQGPEFSGRPGTRSHDGLAHHAGRILVRRGRVLTVGVRSYRQRAFALPVFAVAAASLLFAACSSTKASTATSGNTPTTAGGSPTTAMSDAAITVSASNIPGVGTVLVDGNGRTLYILASEKGGKVNCTSSGGCTTIWPPVLLPSGMAHGIAGNGVQASLLGTVTGPAGDVRLTYAGWPLYTFESDTAPGQAKGQNLKDVYGLWLALSPSGNPITTSSASSTATTAAKAPTTAAPATSPPATAAPATSPPATSPPTTSPPATTAPPSGGAGF